MSVIALMNIKYDNINLRSHLRRIIDGTAHVTGDWKVTYLLLTVTDSTHEASGDIVINNCHVWLYNINFHEEDVMVN